MTTQVVMPAPPLDRLRRTLIVMRTLVLPSPLLACLEYLWTLRGVVTASPKSAATMGNVDAVLASADSKCDIAPARQHERRALL